MTDRLPPYFANHMRRMRFPWSLYHAELDRRIGRLVRAVGPAPRVLVVGCGLEPTVPGGPEDAQYYACDVDARAIEDCRRRFPAMQDRLALCPDSNELPFEGAFAGQFDVVLAKEVIEHVDAPEAWARTLARRVGVGGELILTTPNYGRFSTLPWIERTILEWLARRDGYSRKHIHPSRFDKRRLAGLRLDSGMRLVGVERAFTGWTLVGGWRRVRLAES